MHHQALLKNHNDIKVYRKTVFEKRKKATSANRNKIIEVVGLDGPELLLYNKSWGIGIKPK